MNVQQALAWVENQLAAPQNNQDAVVDARFLLSHLLQKSFTWIKTWPQHCLTDEQIDALKAITLRRQQGEPIAYIVGHRDFWNLTLKCTAASLIPRPETELLVELALSYLEDFKQSRVLDLGTGTGAIGLAIAKQVNRCQVIAVDFSADAVALCEQNKQLNQVKNFKVLQSDWFDALGSEAFQLIVTNPPYVAAGDPHLGQGDLRFEPNSALVAADNGLADIRHIIQQAPNYLLSQGALMIEHGFQQADEIRKIFKSYGFIRVASHQDLCGNDRVTLGYKQ